jgi:hypothetical protein
MSLYSLSQVSNLRGALQPAVSPLVTATAVSKFAIMLVTFRQLRKGGHVASEGSNERRNAYKPRDLNCSYITSVNPWCDSLRIAPYSYEGE